MQKIQFNSIKKNVPIGLFFFSVIWHPRRPHGPHPLSHPLNLVFFLKVFSIHYWFMSPHPHPVPKIQSLLLLPHNLFPPCSFVGGVRPALQWPWSRTGLWKSPISNCALPRPPSRDWAQNKADCKDCLNFPSMVSPHPGVEAKAKEKKKEKEKNGGGARGWCSDSAILLSLVR